MQLSLQQLDRAVGAVLASAAGDALGSQYEFGPSMADSVIPEFGVGVFGHTVGEWTDDTSMAMPILHALSAGRTLEDSETIASIVSEWKEWARTAKDVGAQTRGVLSALRDKTDEDAARQASEDAHTRAGRNAENGSPMRTGPVTLGYLDRSADELASAAGRVAQLTHWESDNVDACVLWCLAIRHAILTGELDVRAQLPWVPAERRARWEGFIDEATAIGIHPRQFESGNGWVVRAFQGALAAITGATSLRDALERAVRGGGDTDTVAAIAGSLAGAAWGASALPLELKQPLHGWPGIDANELSRLATLAALRGAGVGDELAEATNGFENLV
jgi:ADP-ribosyl-[dinitrogen reductase] hydrolase